MTANDAGCGAGRIQQNTVKLPLAAPLGGITSTLFAELPPSQDALGCRKRGRVVVHHQPPTRLLRGRFERICVVLPLGRRTSKNVPHRSEGARKTAHPCAEGIPDSYPTPQNR